MPITATVTKKTLSLPPEVLALAKELGVDAYLPAMARVLQEVFWDAEAFKVDVDEDPEIADLRSILFTVEGTWSAAEMKERKEAWYEKTFAVCPAPLICAFTLFINRRGP